LCVANVWRRSDGVTSTGTLCDRAQEVAACEWQQQSVKWM
jgi:hypothetical protein